MSKPAETYQQQLDRLKSRGLIVPNESFALHILEHHNCRGVLAIGEIPKFLTPDEIRRLLDSCDLATIRGQRDYTVLLFLARCIAIRQSFHTVVTSTSTPSALARGCAAHSFLASSPLLALKLLCLIQRLILEQYYAFFTMIGPVKTFVSPGVK